MAVWLAGAGGFLGLLWAAQAWPDLAETLRGVSLAWLFVSGLFYLKLDPRSGRADRRSRRR